MGMRNMRSRYKCIVAKMAEEGISNEDCKKQADPCSANRDRNRQMKPLEKHTPPFGCNCVEILDYSVLSLRPSAGRCQDTFSTAGIASSFLLPLLLLLLAR